MIYYLKLTNRAIDALTETVGKLTAWLSLAMMLITCTVVFLRYVMESSSIAAQESITYFHATLFLMGAAYTLKRDAHVRVDILYRRFSLRGQALVNILGSILFLLPFAGLILFLSLNYVTSSWAIQESSSDPNGLPWVYLLKSLLLLMPVTLILQGIAEIIRNSLFLLGHAQAPLENHDEGMI